MFPPRLRFALPCEPCVSRKGVQRNARPTFCSWSYNSVITLGHELVRAERTHHLRGSSCSGRESELRPDEFGSQRIV